MAGALLRIDILELGLITAFSRIFPVKFRIECIKVFAVQSVLDDPETFTESLIMYDFPLAQEPDRVGYVRFAYQTQDIIIGSSGLLFCCDLVKTTVAENLEKALLFVVQAVSCCDFIRTKIEKKKMKQAILHSPNVFSS